MLLEGRVAIVSGIGPGLGRSVASRVLMVAYTQRRSGNGEKIRIISARRASRKERAAYGTSSTN